MRENGISIVEVNTDEPLTEEEQSYEKGRYKPARKLGFGFLSMFRTMRFITLTAFFFAAVMMYAGASFFRAQRINLYGFGYLGLFSISNTAFSMPICV